ncbi:uncharacterized protein LOC119998521 [Tripterygium wilfordii]|uniref:uncharacterized protein LOC119998521 n=1 Tax=Tripterygium wilfordii TaxID=458696 RepID=UPI0018F83C20|nr:uncharacterized protein LOC119998521 [Tripterygium wilfordii]
MAKLLHPITISTTITLKRSVLSPKTELIHHLPSEAEPHMGFGGLQPGVPSIPAPTFADLQALQPSKLQPPADQLSRRQLQVLEVGSWKQGLLTTLRVNHLNFEGFGDFNLNKSQWKVKEARDKKLCFHSLNQEKVHQPVKGILHLMLISQITNHPFPNLEELKLILVLLNGILGFGSLYGNIPLINEMKLGELISKWVRINLSWQSTEGLNQGHKTTAFHFERRGI